MPTGQHMKPPRHENKNYYQPQSNYYQPSYQPMVGTSQGNSQAQINAVAMAAQQARLAAR
jgi:hypothetical protein